MSDIVVPGSRRHRAGIPAQLALVLVAAFAVQVLLPFRGDSTAHTLGGAALSMAVGALTPGRLLRRSGPLAEGLIFGLVVVVAWVTEMSLLGPFDLLDVTFAAGGSFVALAALPCWAELDRGGRVRLGAGALGLIWLAIVWRYGLRIGHG